MATILAWMIACGMGQLVDSGAIAKGLATADQPSWLVAQANFERAGELMVAGNYADARKLLESVEQTVPVPYQSMARDAALSLPTLTHDGEHPGGGDVDDLFAVREFDDPSGENAASHSQAERRSVSDLSRLAAICRHVEAHAAALTLYRRCWEKSGDRNMIVPIVELLYITRTNPEDAVWWIDKIPRRDSRDYWEKQLDEWRNEYQHAASPQQRLVQWNGEAPLARLHELELLRPLLGTKDERITLLRQQMAAFERIRDERMQSAHLEAIINIADDRPDICGELLYKAAMRHRHGDRHDCARAHEYCQRIVDEHPTAPQLYQALDYLGAEAYRTGDWPATIKYYSRLFGIAEAHNAKLPVGKWHSTINLHWEASRLSRAYYHQGNIPEALKYARWARDKHSYQSNCGTGYNEHLSAVRFWVDELESLSDLEPASRTDFVPVELIRLPSTAER